MHRVRVSSDGRVQGDLESLAAALTAARRMAALTGAGISVESGIPDFRSPGGLWSAFDPAEYATLSCFLHDPEKAWRLYRALGATLVGARPNPAHRALADLEASGRLLGIVTQNIDGLHQAAGSRSVLEIHGDVTQLHCPYCGRLEPMRLDCLDPGSVPRCAACGRPTKPNIVLFEEKVRKIPAIEALIEDCDLLLVIGTSAEVAPASLFPEQVRERGGSLVEFNLEPTRLTARGLGPHGFFVQGPVGTSLPLVVGEVRGIEMRKEAR